MNSRFKELITLNPEFFEIQILASFLCSQNFYDTYGPKINAYNIKLRGQLKFASHRNNILYEIIDTFRGSEAGKELGEVVISRQWVDDMVSQMTLNGNVTPSMTQGFSEFLDSVYTRATPEIVKSIQGDAFSTWFDVTLVEDFARSQLASNMVKTPDEVREEWESMMSLRSSSQAKTMTFGEGLVRDNHGLTNIYCDIPKLNDNLGGGFRRAESTLFAATTGGGKTVMATQLANAFAYSKWNTLLVTTEQKPNELTPRMISNNLNIPFSEFQAPGEERIVIPNHIMKVPRQMKEIADMTAILSKSLRFLDWSDGEGKSVEKDLDAELDMIVNDPKDPFDFSVLIFDWIGGALARNSRRERREIYLDAANHLHELAKKRNICVIMFAQLNKRLAEGKSTCNSSMLAECVSMPDNATNAVYISTRRPEGGADDGDMRSFDERQTLMVDKARKGPGGKINIKRDFKFQRFAPLTGSNSTTSSEDQNNRLNL